MFWALMKENDAVLAEGDSFHECETEAKAMGHDPDTYIITNIEPRSCSWCGGNGYFEEYGEEITCGPCGGSGYSAGRVEVEA